MKTKITKSFLVALLISASLISQTVSTFPDGNPDDAIAIDATGNIYASSFTGGTVFKYTPAGVMTSFITGLQNPNGIDFDSNGNLYVSEWGGNKISRYDSNGVFDSSITIPNNPSGMIKAFNNDDMIYTRYNGNTINRLTPGGVLTQISADPLLNGPVGLAYDSFGDLYVGNYNDRKIYKVLANGDLLYIATVGNVSNLGFIAFGHGKLWGTVLGEHKIYVIEPNSTDDVTVYAGSTAGNMDGPLAQATFNQPNGILFNDTEDVLYITDFGTKNVRVITGVTLGTNESIKNESFKIYPNPVEDGFQIKSTLTGVEDIQIKIYNVLGKLVFSEDLPFTNGQTSEVIKTDSWNEGTYFVKVTTSNYSTTKKVIK